MPPPSAGNPPNEKPASAHWAGAYFHRLGAEIAQRIAGRDLSSDFFADIATATLQDLPPPQAVDAQAMADWMATAEPLARQVNFHGGFGQPPLVVYVGPGFYLEVLFWFPSRTSIHGHGFSGAFRVLNGYSIQTTYTFEDEESWGEGLRIGKLKPTGLDLLLPGAICDIRSQEAFVHNVVHMGFPSLTLVARTFWESDLLQYSYWRCGVAYAPARRRHELTRQLDVLLAFARCDGTGGKERLTAFLRQLDGFGRFAICYQLASRAGSVAGDVLEWAAMQWPRVVATARAIAEEDRRAERVFGNISLLPDARAQLLAALAEVFGSKDGAMEALRSFHPDAAPEATLAKWTALVPPLPRGAGLP